jgi:RNA polymerase sigma-70 factor, ECF subfamily
MNAMAGDFEAILAKCRRGDRNAQRQLYERYCQRVYGLAVRFAGQSEADDLTQDIFLRIFAGLGSFQGKACFSTWLYRVALNECLRYRRGVQPAPDRLAAEPISRDTAPGRRLEESEILEHALRRLEPSLRAVFLLRHVEDMDYRQISAVLEIPISTAATRLSRARSELQRLLEGVVQGS